MTVARRLVSLGVGRFVSGLLIGVVCAGACGASATPDVGGWSRVDLQPVTQPANVAGVLVVMVGVAERLKMMGITASGRTLWTRPASRSVVPAGEPPSFAVAGSELLYLSPAGQRNNAAELTAMEAGSGRVLWHGAPEYFRSWPAFCPGQPQVLCLSGTPRSDLQDGVEFRFDLKTGELRGTVDLSDPLVRLVSAGLFDLRAAKPEALAVAADTRLAWREPVATIFNRPGASMYWGWDFDRVDRGGLFVGSPGWAPTQESGLDTTFYLPNAMTAGFRISDGSVVWRDFGTSYVCDLLPCPGLPPAALSTQAASAAPTVGIRLRRTGWLVNGAPSASATVTLQGFDPLSGRAIWTFDAGHNDGLISELQLPPQSGAHTLLLPDRRGQLEDLDLATGARRPASAGSVGWCRQATSFVQQTWGASAGTLPELISTAGQDALFPCDSIGQRVAVATAPSFVGEIGARIGRLIVWSDTRGLIAALATA